MLLGDEYPESAHVRDAGLRGAADEVIWEHARNHRYVIVSKDDDFRHEYETNSQSKRIIDTARALEDHARELVVRVNDRITAIMDRADPAGGFIALQHWQKGTVRFRGIRLREL